MAKDDFTLDLPGDFPLDMVCVEPGTFIMSKNDGENESDEIEREVTLTQRFWIGRTPVTQGQWHAVMNSNPSHFTGDAQRPVECVNMDNILNFLDKLNKMFPSEKAGYVYSLPTEAQWEYAAQGGHKRTQYTKYAGSNELDPVGWFTGGATHPVAMRRPNELGLYDMSGNINELCSDFYENLAKAAGPVPRGYEKQNFLQKLFTKRTLIKVTDPLGPPSGTHWVARGGSYYDNSNGMRSRVSHRESFDFPGGCVWYILGFRLALVPKESADFLKKSVSWFKKDQAERKARALEEEKRRWAACMQNSSFDFSYGNAKFTMVTVAPGSFVMAHYDGENRKDEVSHKVTLTKHYMLGQTPVTQGQWKAVMGHNPSNFKRGDNYPVEYVSWDDIQEFLKKLNEMYAGKLPAGYKFDLPTEAQWEYAAQGGHKRQKHTKYAGSNNLNEVGWYDDNSDDKTHPVGQKSPNELGLYDMSGNVWEWCKDWYGDYNGDATDPYGPATGSRRVLRGGKWGNFAEDCRCANRVDCGLSGRSSGDGFRLALVAIPKEQKHINIQAIDATKTNLEDNLCTHKLLTFELPNKILLNMIFCKSGSYIMGCNQDSLEARFSVKQHMETIPQDYYLGQCEVTQAQYEAVMGINPSYFKGPNNPVEQVTGKDAEAFCKKLNSLLAGKIPTGYIFTLPTEAEWEWAAYGCNLKKPFIYSGSNDYNDVAWNCRNSGGHTHPVAQKKPNQLGFFDLSGNVFERCYSDYNARSNHEIANSCRGGAWGGHEIFCRPAANAGEKNAVYHVGFRLALVLAR